LHESLVQSCVDVKIENEFLQ